MTIGGNARPAQPVTAAVLPRGPAGGGGTPGWDEFIRDSGPWFWWRLAELGTVADLLPARDKMKRLDAQYRTCQDDGSPPAYDPLTEFFGTAPADPPFYVLGVDGLVSDNPNKATRFRDTGAWAETPYTMVAGPDAQGYFPWFPNFTALCLFEIESVGPSFSVIDFFVKLTPGVGIVPWRAGVYGDTLPLTLFADLDGGSSGDAAAGVVTGGRHLLVVTHEITMGGFDPSLFRWRGDWDTHTIYAVNDVVNTITEPMFTSPTGNVYVATAETFGDDPADGAPWTAVGIDSSTMTVYLDDVSQFSFNGFGSFGQPDVFRMFTSMEPGNGIGSGPELAVIGDECVVWARVLTADERATALELSGV